MSGIGLQLATDEELLGFQHHSQPKHENTLVICKVESGFNTACQQLTLNIKLLKYIFLSKTGTDEKQHYHCTAM